MDIVDAHIHLYDNKVIPHGHLDTIDPLFENLFGDYASLPRKYLIEDYQVNTNHQVTGIVWHEFVSDQPNKEIDWAANYLKNINLNYAMVAKIDFSDPNFDREIDFLTKYSHITAIRQHMAYHPTNPLKRFTDHRSYFENPTWQRNLKKISQTPYKCGLEIFSSQLNGAIEVIKTHPNIEFTIDLMGWPYSITPECFTEWKKQIQQLSTLDNFCVKISALESIFGMQWTNAIIQPWVDSLISAVGINRCMFGSHSPICNLAYDFQHQLNTYTTFFDGLSDNDNTMFFHDVAQKWFRLSNSRRT